ncbi:hypothetical protein GKC29_14315 [Micromonospora sp. WMMC415]|uniref:hypothetical protein n=1 Tax=Micromonospora sp. WMMC415 TaxID=2675222 RepID=UPI0012B48F38|nr:hypothetical protein [Micromonospora sp. WMMC415]QGN47906.1 hypothetical protein GKC29_14315 [Micromonospora sp. WMMC415]
MMDGDVGPHALPVALPECGDSAATRIEVYSADSLDANAYTCHVHTDEALAAIGRAGLHGHPVPLAPDITRPCGHVHVYPTGQLGDRHDPGHPPWCDRAGCTTRGQHRSVQLPISVGQPEAAIAYLALTRCLAPALEPALTLTVVDGDTGTEVVLSLGQGRVLSYRVRRLLDLATRHPGRRPRR